MSEIFTTSGEKSENVVTPTPQLQGLFVPGIDNSLALDGFGIVTPWGGGSTTRRYVDYGYPAEVSRQTTQLRDLASSLIPTEGESSFSLEGLIGPQGIPGRDGIDGITHVIVAPNSNFLTALPNNLDLINALGTASDKLIYTSAYTAFRNFVWANSPIAAVSSWNDSDINDDASFLIIAGDVGIYISTDDGDSWGTDNPDADAYIQTSCASASGEAVVLGNAYREDGTVWVTDDYGVNWSEKTVSGSSAAKEKYEGSDGTGASIYGVNWGMQSWTTTSAYSAVSVAMYCYKYGSPGNITVGIREVDENGKPEGNDLCSVTVADSVISAFPTRAWYTFTFDTPYALSDATQYAIVFRAPSGSGLHYFGPFGYGSSGYAGGGFAASSNSGTSWGAVSATTDMDFRMSGAAIANVRSVHLGSDGSFLVAAAETGVYLSTDLGDNWSRKTPDSVEDTDWVRGICSDDGTYIIVVSSANAIYRSANSGTAWGAITPAGGDTFSVNKLATSDDGQFMVIVGQNSTDATESCYISTDYGATWTAKKPVAASIEWTECDISNDGAIIAVSTSTYFYISFDSGTTWLEQGMASTAEVWEGLSISGDGTTGLVANTDDNNEVFLGTNTLLYSEATWAESALTSAGRAILDDADAPAQATTLGLGTGDSPTWVGATLSAGPLDLTGKLTTGSFSSPVDVTNTREYGVELHYSGNNYNATAIRARAHAVTSDTAAQFQGGLFQAANNDGIDVGVLNGIVSEAIGKSGSNSATIGTMRGGFSGAEWGVKDTVTNLFGHHIRVHSLNAAGEGSFGTGYGLYIENEAVGGNGQALSAGMYFKGTNLSAGNKAFTYGIDFTGGTYGTSQINLIAAGSITMAGTQVIKFDDTNYNVFLGSDTFDNDDGQLNIGIGYQAGYNNSTVGSTLYGDTNIYIGYRSGYGATGGTDNTGWRNVAVGSNTLYHNTTGLENMAFGDAALYSNTSGQYNVAVGASSLHDNLVGRFNVAVGRYSQYSLTGAGGVAGWYNVGIGVGSLRYNVIGNNNVGIGESVGLGTLNNSYSNNVFLGSNSAFSITTASDCVYIGFKSGYNQTNLDDRLIIDNKDQGSAAAEITDSLIYGIFSAAANDPASQSLRINAEILGSDGAKIGDVATNNTVFGTDGTMSQTGTAQIKWTKITANNITQGAGTHSGTTGDTNGNVADIQSAGDETFYHIDEAQADPAIELTIEFTSVTSFNWVKILATYDGQASHMVQIALYNFNTTTWDCFSAMDAAGNAEVATPGEYTLKNHDFFVPDYTNYIGTAGGDAGDVRVRFRHTFDGNGNTSDDLDIDVVALYQ